MDAGAGRPAIGTGYLSLARAGKSGHYELVGKPQFSDIAEVMIRYAIAGMLVSAALMASAQLMPALAQNSEDPGTQGRQPPAAETPAAPGDSQDTAKEPDDQSNGFERYGPGCPYDGRELEPLLVGGASVIPVCSRRSANADTML